MFRGTNKLRYADGQLLKTLVANKLPCSTEPSSTPLYAQSQAALIPSDAYLQNPRKHILGNELWFYVPITLYIDCGCEWCDTYISGHAVLFKLQVSQASTSSAHLVCCQNAEAILNQKERSIRMDID